MAKTTQPRRHDVLARTRLFDAIDAALQRPVVWLSAQPGAGKTTLVASYLHARKRHGLWYQVDDGDADVASLLDAGPAVLSVPVGERLADVAGYLVRFLERGGRIAWGVVPTDGPIVTTSERSWRQLSDVWCELVRRGCDPVVLRQQSLVTPQCGLGLHTPSVADRVLQLTREVGRRVNEQAGACRFALGA